jgi:hypothetical protein
VPETAEAVPVAHKFSVGAEDKLDPLAEPQEPFTGEHISVVAGLLPKQGALV